MEAVVPFSDQGQTARAVAGCPLVTLFSVGAKQDVQRCVKIARNLGSSSSSFGLGCKETTGKARLPGEKSELRQQIVRRCSCALMNACPRDG